MRRRDVLGLSAAGLLVPGALMPRLSHATTPDGRRFLFLFCEGGWDPSYVMAPLFDAYGVDTEDDADVGEAGGIAFVDHEARPSVREFFELHGDRTTILNGIEVPSVTHGRCTRFLFTGQGDSGGDDWPTILAASSAQDLLMPHAVISGPAFSDRFGSSVVRLGPSGQLVDLLDPEDGLLPRMDVPVSLPGASTAALVDDYVVKRAQELSAAAGDPKAARYNDLYAASLKSAQELRDFGLLDEQGDATDPIMQGYNVALDALQDGLSRCAIVDNLGLYNGGWDTHAANREQSQHFELLFGYLLQIMDELDSRPGPAGGTLADETVLVVCSEMGRGPLLNAWGGKDHHTWTSMMIIGGGVEGGRVLGGYTDEGTGATLDLATAEPDPSGVTLHSADVGATLLALGDVDPAEYVTGTPLAALLA